MGGAIARSTTGRTRVRGGELPPGATGGPLAYAASLRGVTWGNRARLLFGGAEAFPAMLGSIEGARRDVLLESYIFADDQTGREFAAALVAAARRGAIVRLIVDGVGSLGRLAWGRVAELERAGIGVLVYRPPAPWRRRPGLWRRDHRKILAVDGETGFLGGLNIADEYDERRGGVGSWRDLHLELKGPAVMELVRLFAGAWNGESDLLHRLVPPSLRVSPLAPDPEANGGAVQIVGTRFWPKGGLIRRSFLHAVHRASRSIAIANPYFIPDRSIVRALTAAAQRGVDVRVVIPRRSDILLVDLAARARLLPLLRSGVKVAEWPHGMLHAKAAAVDQTWATVGSFNFDHRSLRHNLEVTANLLDPSIAAGVEARLISDFNASAMIDESVLTRRPLLLRLASWLAYQLRAWL